MYLTTALVLCVFLTSNGFANDLTEACFAGTEAFRRASYSEAALSFQKCLTLANTMPDQAVAANDYAATLHVLGREEEARQWFTRAGGLWRQIPGKSDETAVAALGIADADRGLGNFAAAEGTLRSALECKVGSETEAALRNALGDMLREQGRIDESRPQFQTARGLQEISPARTFDSIIGLADLDRRVGRRSASIEGWNEAVRVARESSSPIREALALRGLGMTWFDSGELAKATPLLRRSLALLENDIRTSPPQLAAALSTLAVVYRAEKKNGLAESLWLRALEEDRKSIGDEHPQAAVVMEFLAELYSSEKHFEEARRHAIHAHAIMARSFGENSIPTAGSIGIIGRIKQREGDTAGAATDYAEGLRVLRANNGMGDRLAVEMLQQYAIVLSNLHRMHEAKEIRTEMKSFKARQ